MKQRDKLILQVPTITQAASYLLQRGVVAVTLGDIHIGAATNRAKRAWALLQSIDRGNPNLRVILQGDTFHSSHLGTLDKGDRRLVQHLRMLCEQGRLVNVVGNHDHHLWSILADLGAQFDPQDHYVYELGDSRILVRHGDVYENITKNFPKTVYVGDMAYGVLRSMDGKKMRVSSAIKKASKILTKVRIQVRDGACAEARALGCNKVVCGHTHIAEIVEDESVNPSVWYYNAGHSLDEIGIVGYLPSGELILVRVDP